MTATRTALLTCSLGLLAACGGADDAAEAPDAAVVAEPVPAAPAAPMDTGAAAMAGATATAMMRDSTGRDVGTLTLSDAGGAIQVSGRLTGLAPGTHAIHLHATGRCEPTFEAAGGHWNPTGAQHGTESPQGPHLGDMPNVEVGADGTADVSVTTPPGASLAQAMDADGVAVMVHAGPDDYRTDPSGAAGARVACGVMTRS